VRNHEAVHVVEHDEGIGRVAVYHDECAESPRDWDNVAQLLCWHNRYRLGDKNPYATPQSFLESLRADFAGGVKGVYTPNKTDFPATLIREVSSHAHGGKDGWLVEYEAGGGVKRFAVACSDYEDDFVPALREDVYIQSLYLYDHSGITMSTSPFSCPWDSGQVGFAYVDRATVEREWGKIYDVRYTDENEKICVVRAHEITHRVPESYRYFMPVRPAIRGWFGSPARNNTVLKLRRVDILQVDEIDWRERACIGIHGEVETYDSFLRGDVYYCVAEDAAGNEIESCGGFIGSDAAEEYALGDGFRALEREALEAEKWSKTL